MEKKRSKKFDILLIAGLVVAGAIIALVLLLSGQKGSMVQVRVSGRIEKTFPLNADTSYEIEGKNGGKNLLIIQNGTAWIEEADCPDKLCKNMGKISMTGQSVVCLPHEVVVEIVDENSADDSVDIVVE